MATNFLTRNSIVFILALGVIASCQVHQDVTNQPVVAKSIEPAGKGSILLEGAFTGINLYVQNPFRDDGTFCTCEVIINNTITLDSADLNSSAFEIPLMEMNLEHGDPVKIRIVHWGDCKPKVLNPAVH